MIYLLIPGTYIVTDRYLLRHLLVFAFYSASHFLIVYYLSCFIASSFSIQPSGRQICARSTVRRTGEELIKSIIAPENTVLYAHSTLKTITYYGLCKALWFRSKTSASFQIVDAYISRLRKNNIGLLLRLGSTNFLH